MERGTPAVTTCNGDVEGGFFPAYGIAGVAAVGAAVQPLHRPQVQNAEAAGGMENSVRGKGLPVLLPGKGVHRALCHIAEHLAGGPGHQRTAPEPRARHWLWNGNRNSSSSQTWPGASLTGIWDTTVTAASLNLQRVQLQVPPPWEAPAGGAVGPSEFGLRLSQLSHCCDCVRIHMGHFKIFPQETREKREEEATDPSGFVCGKRRGW